VGAGLSRSWVAKSNFDAEGYDGCARRVTINKKSPGVPLLTLQDLTNPAAR
jgi:hypothetical protein